MNGRETVNTNIRLNLARAEDRKAWNYLQSMDRKHYKSYSRAVVAALNDYFSRQERLDADPYLETREKEDTFLQRVLETIRYGLLDANRCPVLQVVQGAAVAAPAETAAVSTAAEEDDFDTAMDFINAL